MSLWGDEEDVDEVKKLIDKVKKPKKTTKSTEQLLNSKSVSVEEKVKLVIDEVNKVLGKYSNATSVITDYDELSKYIDKAIDNGVIAIDTETNNTINVFDCKLMGLCLYTPGLNSAYIPVNHTDINTGLRLDYQLNEDDIKAQLVKLSNTTKIFHNATFDIEVIENTCGVRLDCEWDSMIAARVLNENERAALKEQYVLHIDSNDEVYSIEKLFKGLPYAIFDPSVFALYAATDALKTYKLYEWQKSEFVKPDNKDIYELYTTIEIPVIKAVVAMEMNGIKVDLDYASRLSTEYHRRSQEIDKLIYDELENLRPDIEAWRLTRDANLKKPNANNTGYSKSKSEQLSDPIKLNSPTQLAILLYDVLKVPVVDKKKPRGTDADILKELSHDFPICRLITDKRGVDILINTFIDKMPEVMQSDGKVHARFNQYGADTGRFSSSDPNLQNIPSNDKAIRMMFKASDGYSLVGGDYSGQEPRSLCSFSKDADMKKAYEENKDLYAVIASKCFHNSYEDNLEFHPITKVKSQEGAHRRSIAKTIFLGISYGMSARTLSERIGLPLTESEQIIKDFYEGFPGVKNFTDESQDMLRKYGYITDMFGRRRRIPSGALPYYEVKPVREVSTFNPLLGAPIHIDNKVESDISYYTNKITNAKNSYERNKLIAEANKNGYNVTNNSTYIARALRQCLNARIQGTAASMTKLALIKIVNDDELNDLGFRLLVTVHDEIFGECPTENSERCGERLCEVMVEAAKYKCNFSPWSVDPYRVKRWYADEFSGLMRERFDKLVSEGYTVEAAEQELVSNNSFVNPDVIHRMIFDDSYDVNREEFI